MTLTNKQIKELNKLSRPLIKFLCDNCHPHVYLVVEPTRVELLEGVMSLIIKDYVRD